MKPDRFGCELEFLVHDKQDDFVIEKLDSLFESNFLVDTKKSNIPSDTKET